MKYIQKNISFLLTTNICHHVFITCWKFWNRQVNCFVERWDVSITFSTAYRQRHNQFWYLSPMYLFLYCMSLIQKHWYSIAIFIRLAQYICEEEKNNNLFLFYKSDLFNAKIVRICWQVINNGMRTKTDWYQIRWSKSNRKREKVRTFLGLMALPHNSDNRPKPKYGS